MTFPDILQLQQAAEVIVRQAHQQERSITPRMIRSELELHFSLEPGTLDSAEYKHPLKQTIESAVLSLDQELDECSTATVETLPKAQPVSRKGARYPANIGQGKHRQPVKRKREDHVKEYKSAPVIYSDAEDELESTSHKNSSSQRLEDTLMEFNARHDFPHTRPNISQANEETAFKVMEHNITKSEPTTLTSVDQVPRQRKKPRADTDEPQEKARGKKSKATTSISSKDEATIKRLKSFVVACGVRKIWSRVFENVDAPAQQIKKLREILAELGMSGRLSLEQAKRIKERRELAKELEDVQSFQQSVVARTSRFRKASRPNDVEMDSESDAATDDAEGATVVPMPRKRTAFQSIAAFLEDQSDNE